jgi:hypothetical protein
MKIIFVCSRNLGAEFGSAVGILFYLANTVCLFCLLVYIPNYHYPPFLHKQLFKVATSMYLVGGVEV